MRSLFMVLLIVLSISFARAVSLSGKVLGPDKTPAAGTVLLVAEVNTRVTTDKAGAFTLDDLPEGAVTLVAVQGVNAAVMKVRAGEKTENVTLTLRPPVKLPEQDVQRAYTMLIAACASAKDFLIFLPLPVAMKDPDLAVKLVQDARGAVPDELLMGIIIRLALADPAKAVAWAPTHLVLIKDERMRDETMEWLGLLIAREDPELAAELYRQTKGRTLDSVPDKVACAQARRAALAAVLKNGDTEQLAAQAIATAKKSPASKDALCMVSETLAQTSPSLAEKAATTLTGDARVQALTSVMQHVAYYDDAAARRIFLTHRELKRNPRAILYAIQIIGKRDPAGAATLARTVKDRDMRPSALALAAQFQQKAVALRMLHDAFTLVPPNDFSACEDLPRIARMAYDIDPSSGKELFARARVRLATLDRTQRSDGNAQLAYYGSAIDPAESRLLIEAEFAQRLQAAANGSDEWTIDHLPLAMAPLDIDRAVELAYAIPNQQFRDVTLLCIAEYVLATTAARANIPLSHWQHGNAARWTLSAPVGW